MPLELDELEGLEPAAAGMRGKIDEEELLEMLGTQALSAKEVKEHFNTAHGTANSCLTKLFLSRTCGRVKKGISFYYSLWENFPSKHQSAFDEQIAIIEAKAQEAAEEEGEE